MNRKWKESHGKARTRQCNVFHTHSYKFNVCAALSDNFGCSSMKNGVVALTRVSATCFEVVENSRCFRKSLCTSELIAMAKQSEMNGEL